MSDGPKFKCYWNWKDGQPHYWTWTEDNPAFAGMNPEARDVICNTTVTTEMVEDFGNLLEAHGPMTAKQVIAVLEKKPWFTPGLKYDSKTRLLRLILDVAVYRKYNICASNIGYYIGDWFNCYEAADRKHRHGVGSFEDEAAYKELAEAIVAEQASKPSKGKKKV